MPRKLQTQISLTIALVVLITISLISFFSNIIIAKAFDSYIQQKQAFRSGEIAANIERQYAPLTQTWDVGFVHGIGMYALYDGYIVKLYDAAGGPVWDAENHNASLCSQMMADISRRMKARRPDISGQVMSGEYPMTYNGQSIGRVEITYYGPYFFSESDLLFLDTLNMLLLSIGVFSFVCSLVAGYFLSRRITRPVAQAAEAARAISQGDYGICFDGDSHTHELTELTQAIDALAKTISRQEALRKRLTSDVAHELRTPLSAVAAHLEAMIEGVWPATSDRLQGCYDEIDRISGLVAELEKLSTIEDENLRLNRRPVDLLERAQATAENYVATCHAKRIGISTGGSNAIVLADPEKLEQVLINLLSNAVKYTPQDGHIRMAVSNEEKYGVLEVCDDGIGIDAAELSCIFERFYRTDQSRSRATGGAGIGLSIVKAIVAAHGGTIEAQSEKSKGSRFIVRIPKA
ncbi:MAG TPA: HAMP domain-containing sensor histidine kinase [Clostridia bacterium]|nr:HAMP domain-containing sensor histidine kinase [Clostridia bacterium]